MLISLVIAFAWNKVPIIKNSVDVVLIPTAGSLLQWNLTFGMLIIVFMISLIISIAQKYLTDQETLKEIKKEQKALREEMNLVKDDPAKIMELNKKQMQKIPLVFEASMRPLIYTAIPFIIFFRWFNDFFISIGNPKFFGFLSWFWFYLIASIIFSSILRKVLKVA